jgi:hypothetical protein
MIKIIVGCYISLCLLRFTDWILREHVAIWAFNSYNKIKVWEYEHKLAIHEATKKGGVNETDKV